MLTVSVCRCKLEPTGAEVGEAFYGHEKKVHLILRNTGQITISTELVLTVSVYMLWMIDCVSVNCVYLQV